MFDNTVGIPQYIEIDLPPEIFDSVEATIRRRKRIPMSVVSTLQQLPRTVEGETALLNMLADIYPTWNGVYDHTTGQPLPHPKDNPEVFRSLDITEQWPWLLSEGLRARPTSTAKNGR